jgi:hypothetical protein
VRIAHTRAGLGTLGPLSDIIKEFGFVLPKQADFFNQWLNFIIAHESRAAAPWTTVYFKTCCAFPEGNYYTQQHIVADLSASDSLTKHINGFLQNFR